MSAGRVCAKCGYFEGEFTEEKRTWHYCWKEQTYVCSECCVHCGHSSHWNGVDGCRYDPAIIVEARALVQEICDDERLIIMLRDKVERSSGMNKEVWQSKIVSLENGLEEKKKKYELL